MQVLLRLLGNKYVLWSLIVAGMLCVFKVSSCQKQIGNERLDTYKRQVQGQLSDMERELQGANHKLGLLKSKLATSEELAKQLKNSKEEVDKQFDEFKKKHNLVIRSRDKTIASLRQQLKGGSTEVVVSDGEGCKDLKDRCVIEYSWQDALGRFKLKDPNIFKTDNEVFDTNQLFKVYGEVWTQKDGSLQTRRLVLREMFRNEDGKLEPIPNGKAEIVDSEFSYSNSPTVDPETSWTDLFKLRAIMVGSITAFPEIGQTHLGAGAQFFGWQSFGINTHTAIDFEDIKNTEQRIGLSYIPRVFDLDLNLAAHLSLGTSFAGFFKDYSVSTGVLFYINN